jgi:hypothetical protein
MQLNCAIRNEVDADAATIAEATVAAFKTLAATTPNISPLKPCAAPKPSPSRSLRNGTASLSAALHCPRRPSQATRPTGMVSGRYPCALNISGKAFMADGSRQA